MWEVVGFERKKLASSSSISLFFMRGQCCLKMEEVGVLSVLCCGYVKVHCE